MFRERRNKPPRRIHVTDEHIAHRRTAFTARIPGEEDGSDRWIGLKRPEVQRMAAVAHHGDLPESGRLDLSEGLPLGGGEVELTVDYRKIGEKTAQAAKSTFEWIDSKMPWNW